MVFHKERGQSLEAYTADYLREGVLYEDDPNTKLENWTKAYQVICDLEIALSTSLWIDLLEDDIIGATIEDREERYEAIIKTLPHANGYPMRVNERTFQPELYIDRKWVGIEAVEKPEAKLVEQQQLADQEEADSKHWEKRMAELEEEVLKIGEDFQKEYAYDNAMDIIE